MSSVKQTSYDHTDGFVLSVAGTALVSTNYLTAKYGLKGFNTETFSLLWCSAAATYSLTTVLATGLGHQLMLPAKTAGKIVVLGLVTGIGMLLSWAGLAILSASLAAFIWRFGPVLSILAAALFLRERLTLRELFPGLLMIAGGVVTTVGQWGLVGKGVMLTLLACCLGAVQGLMAKTAVETVHPNVVVFYRVGLSILSIGLWGATVGTLDFRVPPSYWLITLLGAFLGPFASFLLRYRALRYWPLSRVSLVMAIQPLFVLPMQYLVFGELPRGKELLGGCLILAGGLWFTQVHFSRKEAQ